MKRYCILIRAKSFKFQERHLSLKNVRSPLWPIVFKWKYRCNPAGVFWKRIVFNMFSLRRNHLWRSSFQLFFFFFIGSLQWLGTLHRGFSATFKKSQKQPYFFTMPQHIGNYFMISFQHEAMNRFNALDTNFKMLKVCKITCNSPIPRSVIDSENITFCT